ncbi:MAG: TonB-dependent receptor, partial [Runella zeae]
MKLSYTLKISVFLLLTGALSSLVQAQQQIGQLSQKTDNVIVVQKSDIARIGFDVQPRHLITTAISTVKGIDLEKNFTLNLGNTLYGRLPGLTVQQGGSEPGASTPTLYVRGLNTFGGASN